MRELAAKILESVELANITPRRQRSRKIDDDAPPPTLDRLRVLMATYLGWAWEMKVRQLRFPEQREASIDLIEQSLHYIDPKVVQKLQRQVETIQNLNARDDFEWIDMNQQWPKKGQQVLYYFSVVGVHPGRFEGRDEFGMHSFVGDFAGSLGGDVTHWMPRP